MKLGSVFKSLWCYFCVKAPSVELLAEACVLI
jgi:hypothetical protein